MMNFKKSALAFVALATVATISVACGSKKSSSTPTGTVVTKGNGSAVNLTCNHTAYDPTSTGATVSTKLHIIVQSQSTSAGAAARVVLFNPATGATSGNAVIADGGGDAILPTPDSVRAAFYITKSPNGTQEFFPSVDSGHLTGAVGNTAGSYTLRIADNVVFSVAAGSALGTHVSEVSGKTQVVGVVMDCDGDPVRHATVEFTGATLCKDGPTFPCVAYSTGGSILPNPNATESDESGKFYIFGLGTNDSVTATGMGITATGGAAEAIGDSKIHGLPNSIQFGPIIPLMTP